MDRCRLSRRGLLWGAGTVGLAAVGLLSGCGRGEDEDEDREDGGKSQGGGRQKGSGDREKSGERD